MDFGTYDLDAYHDELAAAVGAPIGTSVLLENDRVRVWDLVCEPGGRIPFHGHRTTYFFTCIEGGRMVNRFPDGNQVTVEMADGDTWFTEIGDEAEVHDLENVGDTRVRFLTVELLSPG